MKTVKYNARVLSDGNIFLPKEIAEKLNLKTNDEIKVIVTKKIIAESYLSTEDLLKLAIQRVQQLKDNSRTKLVKQHKELIETIKNDAEIKDITVSDFDDY